MRNLKHRETGSNIEFQLKFNKISNWNFFEEAGKIKIKIMFLDFHNDLANFDRYTWCFL